eukprot:8027983-Pyramimonas_sp.AAC.1
MAERRQLEHNAVEAQRKADTALREAQAKQQLLENEARNVQIGAANVQAELRRVSDSAAAIRGDACGEAKALIRVRTDALEGQESAMREATELRSLQHNAHIAVVKSQAGHASAKAEAEEAMLALREAEMQAQAE